jgi:RNA polymerase sigma-70 factor (ECF subfamily)
VIEETSQIEQDKALAQRVAAGDGEAFEAFFREYFPRLYRFTLTRVDNDPSLAEEIVQRTMCIVVRKMGSYRGEALLFTWLCGICRNETSALYRKRELPGPESLPIEDHPAVQAALESAATDEHRPEAAQRRDELVRFVRQTLEHLPARYAQALEMKYISGYSVAEIGAVLGVGEKAAESILSRARSAFKDGFGSLWELDLGSVID